jgi:hypothetical protein
MQLRVLMIGFDLRFWALLCEGLVMGLLNSLETSTPNHWSPKESMRLADTCQSALGDLRFEHGLQCLNKAWPWKQGCKRRPKDIACSNCHATESPQWLNATMGRVMDAWVCFNCYRRPTRTAADELKRQADKSAQVKAITHCEVCQRSRAEVHNGSLTPLDGKVVCGLCKAWWKNHGESWKGSQDRIAGPILAPVPPTPLLQNPVPPAPRVKKTRLPLDRSILQCQTKGCTAKFNYDTFNSRGNILRADGKQVCGKCSRKHKKGEVLIFE